MLEGSIAIDANYESEKPVRKRRASKEVIENMSPCVGLVVVACLVVVSVGVAYIFAANASRESESVEKVFN